MFVATINYYIYFDGTLFSNLWKQRISVFVAERQHQKLYLRSPVIKRFEKHAWLGTSEVYIDVMCYFFLSAVTFGSLLKHTKFYLKFSEAYFLLNKAFVYSKTFSKTKTKK